MLATREQHMMLGHVGVARGDQPLDHRDHRRRYARWRAARHRAAAPAAPRRRRGSPAAVRSVRSRMRSPLRLGRGVDLVVDVGDVADIAHVVRAVGRAQQAVEHVEHDRPAAHCRYAARVVDRRPAHIHAHVRGIERLERLLAARQRVVEDSGTADHVTAAAPARAASRRVERGQRRRASWNALVIG